MRHLYSLICAFVLLVVVGFSLDLSGREAGAQARPEGTVGPSFETPADREFAPGRIIVKMDEGATGQAIGSLNRKNDARVGKELPGPRTNLVDLPADLPVQQAVRRYENAPGVEYAEPDFKIEPSQVTPNDPGFSGLYGLNNTGQNGGTQDADIDAPEAWERTTGSADTTIAVIDSGTDISHPDLKGNIWTNPNETENGKDDDGNGLVDDVNGWDFYNDDKTVYDEAQGDEHGTHVSGTVAAEGNNDTGVTGVNWDGRIMPLKFIGPDGGFVSDAVAAIDYAVDNGATISNNSWGGKGESQALRDAIGRAGQQGHLFVSAAGNGGSDGVGDDNDEAPFYPASYANQNIISVAATDRDDRLAGFSNFGDTSVDLGAPGVRILSTLPGGGYGRFSGTSMASPHVAGTAALIKSADPSLSADGLKRRILESAEGKSALRNKTVTGGRLNAATALNAQSRATEVSVSAERSALVFGQRISFSGGLVDASGEPIVGENVVLLERPFGADRFSRVTDGKATTNLQGQFTIDGVKPEKLTVYRALFTGNEAKAIERSVSGPEVVRVRARVTTRTAKDVVSLGRGQGVAGRVLPDHGGRVRLVIFRNGDVFDRERLSLDSNSRFSYVFRPPRRGTYKVYAVFPGDDDHLAKRGPIRTFKVVR